MSTRTPTLGFGAVPARIKRMAHNAHIRIRAFHFLLLTMLVLGPIALATPQSAAANAPVSDPGFSMLVASDPQFPWWRGGEFDPDCFDIKTMSGNIGCEDAKGYQSNREMVGAMGSVTALGSWPTDGLRIGAGNAVTKPYGVTVNGDLTAYGHYIQQLFFSVLYTGPLSANGYKVFLGLGNHDYENNTTAHGDGCLYYTWNTADKNRCAKEAVWRMASAVHHLPNVVNKDVPGRIAVKNNAGYVAFIHGTYWINGKEYSFKSPQFSIGTWEQVLLPPQAAEIEFYVMAITDLTDPDSGVNSEKQRLSFATEACYAVKGTTSDVGIGTGDCPREWPNGSSGSLAYSFDIGNYHFVQLHNHPGYGVSLPYVDITGIDFNHSNGFTITPSWAWLIGDLNAATSRGKRIVLNMHDEGDLPEAETKTLRLIIRDKNVVALFAGHNHERFGILETIKKDIGNNRQISYTYEGNYGTVPVIYSGSSECKTFVLADFHQSYFNVGIVSAQNGKPSFITTPRACDARPLWSDSNGTKPWHQTFDPYGKVEVDKTIASYSFNRAPRDLSITQGAAATEGAPVSFRAHATDPDGDPLNYTWNFGDGTTGVGETVQHTYLDNGIYTVTAVAQDPPPPAASAGNQISTTQSVVVQNVAPTARLTRTANPVYVGVPVTLTIVDQADASRIDADAGFTYSYACQGNIPPLLPTNGPTFTCTFAKEGLAKALGRIRDKDGDFSTYGLNINVEPLPNQPPSAVDDTASTNEEQAVTVNVLANDRDPEGDALRVSIITAPNHGQAVVQPDNTILYTPPVDFNGADSFSYKLNDGALDSNVATVRITVNPVNDVPVAADDSYTTDEDTTLTIAAPGLLTNDQDIDSAALTPIVVSNPLSGTLALNGDGSFSYTPNVDFNGSDSFSYKLNDGALESNAATVQITVNPVNDAPVAADDSYTTDEDTALTIAAPGLLTNDQDADGAALTPIIVSNPLSGTLALNGDGSFSYTPNVDFNGGDSFSYKLNDGALDSNVATVQITVNPVDDSATIALTPGGQCALNNIPSATINLALADLDTSADGLIVTANSSNQDLLLDSTIVISGTGASRTLTLVAAPRQHGQATITVAVSDGHSRTATSVNLLVGTTGVDSLTGTNDIDIIFGLQGDDTITGLGGDDVLCGNDGNDSIDAGDGDDAAYGGDSNDHVLGGAGNDMLDGGKGDDTLDGGAGDDTLVGWSGRDMLSGGDGNDILTGGNSNDQLDGGAGDDTLDGGKGDDILNGGLGTDSFHASAGRDQELDFDAGQGDTHTADRPPALRSLAEQQDAEPDTTPEDATQPQP